MVNEVGWKNVQKFEHTLTNVRRYNNNKKKFQHYPISKVATLSMTPIFETRFDILTMPQDVFIVELGIFICLQVLRVTTVVVIRSKEWFFYIDYNSNTCALLVETKMF
jgi:hypothetical protein